MILGNFEYKFKKVLPAGSQTISPSFPYFTPNNSTSLRTDNNETHKVCFSFSIYFLLPACHTQKKKKRGKIAFKKMPQKIKATLASCWATA